MRVVKHNASDKQYASGMSAPCSMMACFSMLFYIVSYRLTYRHLVVTCMGNSLARQITGTSQGKDVVKSAANTAAKSAAKNAVNNAVENEVKNPTAEKQLFGIYHGCFHFGLGTLLATHFLDPFPRRSGNVSGSLSVQCNPWSNVKRLSVLKHSVHPILVPF